MPVTWEDDWPVLNGNRPVALEFEDKDLYRLELPSKWLDKFDNNEMQLGWYRKSIVASIPCKTSLLMNEQTLPSSATTSWTRNYPV